MLEIKDLYKKFNLEEGLFAGYGRFVYAVNGVSLTVNENETYGLVGESGCGKSTLSRMIAGIYSQDSGEIRIKIGDDYYNRGSISSKQEKIELRKNIRYIFQDPARSLDPRMPVGEILTEGYRYTDKYRNKKEAVETAGRILEMVGLNASDITRRPGEFSGGQRQRISIARALITDPSLLICDEVVSALDVSVQSQIINLLIDIKKERNITMLFISHDLGLVSFISDRVGVMYGGMIVEEAEAVKIFNSHVHPYTKMLYSSVSGKLRIGQTAGEIKASDNPSGFTDEIKGCPFYERCSRKTDICRNEKPLLKSIPSDITHKTACFNPY